MCMAPKGIKPKSMVKSEGMRQLLTRTGEAVQGATCISIHSRQFPLPKVIVIVLFFGSRQSHDQSSPLDCTL